jgi:hypothetical protein
LRKILLLTTLVILGFSGVSNADLLYQDPNDYYMGGWFGANQKTWEIKTGPVSSAQLSISFFDLGFDCWFPEFALIKIDTWESGVFDVNSGTKQYDVTNFLSDGSMSLALYAKGGDFFVTNVQVNGTAGAPVPEPVSMLLFGTGTIVFGGYLRRKLKK